MFPLLLVLGFSWHARFIYHVGHHWVEDRAVARPHLNCADVAEIVGALAHNLGVEVALREGNEGRREVVGRVVLVLKNGDILVIHGWFPLFFDDVRITERQTVVNTFLAEEKNIFRP